MNEGVEIAADVAAGPHSVITDQVTNGVAVRMALLYLLAGTHSAVGVGRGRQVTDLEISRAWLVDPAAGREGPGEIVVRDGILEAVTWLDGADADGIDAEGVVVAPGFIDLHAHLREPGNEDAETIASGLAAAAHGGFTTVCAMPNTTPALDEPGVLARIRAAAAASGSPVELLAIGAVTAGRAGETARRARRAGGRRRRRLQRRWGARPFRGDPAQRAGVRRRARAADHRPSRGPHADRRRGGERRVRRDRPGPSRLAGRGRGRRGRAGHRDPRRRRPRRPGRAAPPDPRLHGRVARPDPRREGARPAGHLRRHAAPPRADRRVGRRGAPLGVGCARRRGRRAIPGRTTRCVGRPYDTSTAREPAAARARSTRPPAWRPCSTAPPTRSPRTTRRTPRSTRRSSSGSPRTGSAASRPRSGCVLAAVDAGRLPLLRAVEALTIGPARILGGRSRRRGGGRARRRRARRPRRLRPVGALDGHARDARCRAARTRRWSGSTLPGRVLLTIAGGRVAYEAPDSLRRATRAARYGRPVGSARLRSVHGTQRNDDYERRSYWQATMPALPDRSGRPLPDTRRRRRHRRRLRRASTRPASWPARRQRSPSSRRTRWAGAPRPATAGSSTPGYKWGPTRAHEALRRGDRHGRSTSETLESYELVKRLIADEAIDCDFREDGHLELAYAPSHVQDLERRRESLASVGVTAATRPARADPRGDRVRRLLRRRSRSEQRRCSTRAATSPASPRPRSRAGADLHEGVRATAIRRQADGRFVVETDRGAILARDVFVATNGYTDGVAPSLRRRVIPIGSYIIASEPLPEDLARGALAEGPVVLRHEELPVLLARLGRPPDDLRRPRERSCRRRSTGRRRSSSKGLLEVHPQLAGLPHRVRVGRQRRLHVRPDAARRAGPRTASRTRSAAAGPASR